MSLSYDEQMAASAVAALAGKRGRESFEDAEMKDCKIARFEENEAMKSSSRPKRAPPAPRELLPAPFFYYRDFSTQPDPDPLVPLTAPGRVPNFPAKVCTVCD